MLTHQRGIDTNTSMHAHMAFTVSLACDYKYIRTNTHTHKYTETKVIKAGKRSLPAARIHAHLTLAHIFLWRPMNKRFRYTNAHFYLYVSCAFSVMYRKCGKSKGKTTNSTVLTDWYSFVETTHIYSPSTLASKPTIFLCSFADRKQSREQKKGKW